jgi:hypothetical protein
MGIVGRVGDGSGRASAFQETGRWPGRWKGHRPGFASGRGSRDAAARLRRREVFGVVTCCAVGPKRRRRATPPYRSGRPAQSPRGPPLEGFRVSPREENVGPPRHDPSARYRSPGSCRGGPARFQWAGPWFLPIAGCLGVKPGVAGAGSSPSTGTKRELRPLESQGTRLGRRVKRRGDLCREAQPTEEVAALDATPQARLGPCKAGCRWQALADDAEARCQTGVIWRVEGGCASPKRATTEDPPAFPWWCGDACTSPAFGWGPSGVAASGAGSSPSTGTKRELRPLESQGTRLGRRVKGSGDLCREAQPTEEVAALDATPQARLGPCKAGCRWRSPEDLSTIEGHPSMSPRPRISITMSTRSLLLQSRLLQEVSSVGAGASLATDTQRRPRSARTKAPPIENVLGLHDTTPASGSERRGRGGEGRRFLLGGNSAPFQRWPPCDSAGRPER